jgi:pimeloyl-ACP methyl ester carboxylesterase
MPHLEGVRHSFHDLPTGVRVHVATMGPADAPPVLALHGWPQHWWAWRDVMRALDRELRIIAPDMRGFGWSDWPADGDFRKQRVADDAIALLDVLELDQVRLVGHDWGGWAAILAALTAPERFSSLLLLGIGHPWVPRSLAARNAYRFAYQIPLYFPTVTSHGGAPRRILEVARRDTAGWAPGEIDTYVAAVRQSPRATARLYRSFAREVLGDFRGRRFAMPARLMLGYREPIGRYVATNFKGETEIVDGVGHFVPEEAPGLVAERIRAMPPPARG